MLGLEHTGFFSLLILLINALGSLLLLLQLC